VSHRPRRQADIDRARLDLEWWVEHELSRMDVDILREHLLGAHAIDPANREAVLAYAIEEARRGDIGPLRAFATSLHPEFSAYVHLPPPRRGRPKAPDRARILEKAVADVARIRTLWKVHGNGPRGALAAAQDIAATRWGISAESIANRMKKRPPK
jgi:hypothetical protein